MINHSLGCLFLKDVSTQKAIANDTAVKTVQQINLYIKKEHKYVHMI